MARTSSKRKSQPAAAKSRYLSKSSKKRKKSNDLYEAQDSDPDEEKHAQRYDHVDNYEYEMPSDFEDEEIDEDLAFTAEDKKKYAGWFGEEPEEGEEEPEQQQTGRKRIRSEFADLESSEEDEAEDEDEEVMFDEGEEEEEAAEQDDMQHQQQPQQGWVGSDDEQQQQQLGSSGDEGEQAAASEEEDEDEDNSEEEEEEEDLDDEQHRAMLAAALGKELPAAGRPAAERRKKVGTAARNAVVAEAYDESEAHAAAAGELRLADLLDGLAAGGGAAATGGAGGLGGARKLLERLDRRGQPVAAPLPRNVAERLERQAGYQDTRQEVTKWQPIVKANREAPSLRFTSARHEVSAAAGSTSALVDGFTPDSADPDGLEAQVAALLGAAGSAGAAAMAEAEQALAEKAYTLEEAQARADRLAKMRHLLFYAELKAKRLAKIKSKEHHRRANKAAKRAAARLAESAGDEEAAARKAAEEAEFERVKERLTLKHKNSSKWARRALKRGQAAMDPGMREAIAAQLALGQQLRRKIEGGRGSGSEGSGDSDASTSASEGEGVQQQQQQQGAAGSGRLLSSRSRKEALAMLKGLSSTQEAGGGLAGSTEGAKQKGLFALPFMVRALEKQRAAAAQEAAALLADMEGEVGPAAAAAGRGAAADDTGFGDGVSGRISFGGNGAAAAAARAAAAAEELSDSDEEEDVEAKAARLTRHLAGEAGQAAAQAAAEAPAKQLQRKQKQQTQGAAAGADSAGAVDEQQQQQQQQPGPDIGFVTIDMPVSQAAAGQRDKTPTASAAAPAAAAPAGAGNGSLPDAHTGLFSSRKKQQLQLQQAVGGPEQPSTSQPPQFLPTKNWQGPKPGYVFKRDKQGLGYYLDTAQQQQQQQEGHKKRKGKGQQQQQQSDANVQALLRRQQQQHAETDSEGEADPGSGAAAGQQQKHQQARQKASQAAAGGTGAAAAGVHAMQLLSGEGDLQRQLLQAAFAGDDVAADFDAEKAAEVSAELPAAEAEGQLPGWGTWAGQHKEPAWMVAAKARAAAKREAAAAARKDAQLKHVMISEKWDKKSTKYLAPSLPFPFKDKVVYETAMRQPLGRQYNPDAAFRNLTRPAVLKDTGVVIEPLRFSKQVEQYNAGAGGKGRAVVTVAGGMQLQGQVAGSGAGGVGKGGGKKKHKAAGGGSKAAAASQRRVRLHEGAGQ